MIRVKRAYLPAEAGDGLRVLVDRLWPRGVRKEKARLDRWAKELAPRDALRKWFGHDPGRWPGFKRRYSRQLGAQREALKPLLAAARKGTVTLVFGAKDEGRNNAVMLKACLEGLLKKKGPAPGRTK